MGGGRPRKAATKNGLLQPQSPIGKQVSYSALEAEESKLKKRSSWGCCPSAGVLVIVLLLASATALVGFEACSSFAQESSGCAALLLQLGALSELKAVYGSAGVGAASGWGHTVREGAEEARWVLQQLEKNGTDRCDSESTSRVMIFGIPTPKPGQPVHLQAGLVHELVLIAYTDNGTRRCGGGDYYETALTGVGWRSRPPLRDVGDGSYLLSLNVPEGITGSFVFNLILLFGNFHGMEHDPNKWAQDRQLLSFDIEFAAPPGGHPGPPPVQLSQCSVSGGDFQLREWKGQWTRTTFNNSCTQPDEDGRFRCLPADAPCDSAWCDGPVGSIDSNGWAYSAHCKFRIFQRDEAWSCLASKWLFLWGDSNHQDTTRNLLNFVLGLKLGPRYMRRSHDSLFSNPANSSQSLRITTIFGGHHDDTLNNGGLSSLRNDTHRRSIQSHFAGDRLPDGVLLNSGLHDGFWWNNVTEYAQGADFAAQFWAGVWKNASRPSPKMIYHSRPSPKMIYHSTIAPAGRSRSMTSNPQKMEAFNKILVDRMLATGMPLEVVDVFDMTFPWHFDNNCSDGGHYGRPPSLNPWMNGQIGHQYFVDVMLGHVLLNALCPL